MWLILLLVIDPNVSEYAEASLKQRSTVVVSLRRTLDSPPKRPARGQYPAAEYTKALETYRRDVAEFDKKRPQVESQIRDLENPLKTYFAKRHPTEAGTIGTLHESVRIIQVIDSRNVIVGLVSFVSRDRGPPDEKTRLYWLSGVPTNGLQDGRMESFDGFFAVTGNRTYETKAGTHTVLVVEPFDIQPHAEKFTLLKEMRTWTPNGNPIQAVFVRYHRGRVVVMEKDGKVSEFQLSALSRADQQYVKEKSLVPAH